MSEKSGPPDPSVPYSVEFVGRARDQFLRLVNDAETSDEAEAMLLAMRLLLDRIERTPNESGDLLYSLRGLRLHVRSLAVRPLLAGYGVHFDRPLAFVRYILRLPTLADVSPS